MTRAHRVIGAWLVVVACGAPAGVSARQTDDVVAADAVTCWWRADTAAVRVGEPFSLALTCAVPDTAEVTVVVDESRLDPQALQLPPYDVIDGARGPDSADGPKRFFQFRYTLRLIADDKFGKDVAIPPLSINYRVRSRSREGALAEGRDLSYVLPPIPIRIVSTVPDSATSIRDGGTELFETIDSRLFRGGVLRALGAVSLGAGVVSVLMAVLALVRHGRGRAPVRARSIPSWLVHRGIGVELQSIEAARQAYGWRPELVDRALVAARIVAAEVLNIPATLIPLKAAHVAPRGTVAVPARIVRGDWVAASSSVTARTVAEARSRLTAGDPVRVQRLEDLEGALAALTAARYGLEPADESMLDQAIATVRSHVRGGWSAVFTALRSRRWTSLPLSIGSRVESD